jgi:hypothetical protein
LDTQIIGQFFFPQILVEEIYVPQELNVFDVDVRIFEELNAHFRRNCWIVGEVTDVELKSVLFTFVSIRKLTYNWQDLLDRLKSDFRQRHIYGFQKTSSPIIFQFP